MAHAWCMAGAGPAAAEIEWTIEQTGTGSDPHQPIVITCSVSNDLTRIAGPKETILIDYPGRRIYRIDPPGQSCRSYPFGRPHPDLPAAAVTIAASTTAPDRQHISFGMQQALAQTAVAPVAHYWGQQFPFATAEYRTSRDYPGVVALMAIAGRHRRVFQQYPLLRRIDPVGLLDLLEGFPVSGNIFSPAGQTIITVLSPPKPTAIQSTLPPPGTCIDME